MSFYENLAGVDIISTFTTRLQHLTRIVSDSSPAADLAVVSGVPDHPDNPGATNEWGILANGWRGVLRGPEMRLPSADSPRGLGEQFRKWWPQPRVIQIPFYRFAGQSRRSLDEAIYRSTPLVLRFRFKAPDPPLFFIACHAVGEREVENVLQGTIEHRIRFRSQWPFFVGAPVNTTTGTLRAPADLQGKAIYGYSVTGATTGSSYDFDITGSANVSVAAPASEFLVCPSFPFEENVVLTTGQSVPDYVEIGGSGINRVTLAGAASATLFHLPNYASLD